MTTPQIQIPKTEIVPTPMTPGRRGGPRSLPRKSMSHPTPHKAPSPARWLLCLFFSFAALPAVAHEASTFDSVPTIEAAKIDGSIRLDGRLDDDAWSRAKPFEGFTQREPVELAPSTERTVLRVLYSDSSLYIGVECFDSDPSALIAQEMERDSLTFRDDSVGLFLDTFHDHRNAYFFETNPNGARTDALLTDEGRDFNLNWDGVWGTGVHRHDQGWSIEFQIPFSTLRFDDTSETWGMQIRRIIRRKNEETYFSPIGLDADVFRISRGGHITGLEGLQTGLQLQVLPYATFSDASAEDPILEDSFDDGFDAGVDVKWAVTKEMSLDLTVNTDFAEAEVDDQQVNLTRFPLFFDEKREFFLENAGIFDFGPTFAGTPLFELFFSRRIGISDDGRQVPIDWGVRFTGRVDDWNIGFIDAQTDELNDAAGPQVAETNWGVLRLKRNIGERSTLGVIYTRSDQSGGNLNQTYGVDLDYKPTQRSSLWAYAARSEDDLFELDDWNTGAGYAFDGGEWDFDASVIDIGEDFNPASGFLLRRGVRRYRAAVAGEPRPENRPKIRSFIFGIDSEYFVDDDDEVETSTTQFDLFGVRNQQEDLLALTVIRDEDNLGFDFPILPGIVIPAGDYDWWRGGLIFQSGAGRKLAVSGNVLTGDFYDGENDSASVTLTWRPSRHFRSQTQWIRNDIELPGGDLAFDIIRQRLEFSFTPDLSLNGILQYNEVADLFGANLRLRWEYRPGSDLFVVYNENWIAPSLSDLDGRDRQVIVKASYLFQL
ncbi:MAG: DUF5916 domain-containing protein [Acidobacteriota bacterium]